MYATPFQTLRLMVVILPELWLRMEDKEFKLKFSSMSEKTKDIANFDTKVQHHKRSFMLRVLFTCKLVGTTIWLKMLTFYTF